MTNDPRPQWPEKHLSAIRETRSLKSETSSNCQMSNVQKGGSVRFEPFPHSSFGFVSDFGLGSAHPGVDKMCRSINLVSLGAPR